MLDSFLIITLLATCSLRASLALNDDGHSGIGDLVTWMDVRPGGRWRDDLGTPYVAGFWNAPCVWSIRIEFMHTLQALQACLITIRLCANIFTSSPKFSRVTQTFMLMTKSVTSELFLMLYALTTLMVGFGIAFAVLSPNSQAENSDGPIRATFGSSLNLDVSAGSAFWQSAWAIHGAFDAIDLASAPSAAVVSPMFLWIYVTFIVLPIVNLLIAMFTAAYDEASAGDSGFSLRSISNVLVHLRMTSAVPPPVNLVIMPFLLVRHVGSCLREQCACSVPADAQVCPIQEELSALLMQRRSAAMMGDDYMLHVWQHLRRTAEDEATARDLYVESQRGRNEPGGSGLAQGASIGKSGAADVKPTSEQTRGFEAGLSAKLDEIMHALQAVATVSGNVAMPARPNQPAPLQELQPGPGTAKMVASNPVTGIPSATVPRKGAGELPGAATDALGRTPPLPRIDAHRVAPTCAPSSGSVAIGAPVVSFARPQSHPSTFYAGAGARQT